MVPRLIFAAVMLCSLGSRPAPRRGPAPVPTEVRAQHATVGPPLVPAPAR